MIPKETGGKSHDIELEIASYTLENIDEHDYTEEDGVLFAYQGKDEQNASFTDNKGQHRRTGFTAISYCWGKNIAAHGIGLNGLDFEVSDNLYRLLLVLQEGNEDQVLLWIDQICIDQSDADERNAQVGLMSFIYSSAEAVYAWLGEETHATSLGFEALQRLEDGEILTHDAPGLLAVSDLLTREYWTRLWIVQEVVYARKLFFLCGSHVHRFGKDPKAMNAEVWIQSLSQALKWSREDLETLETNQFDEGTKATTARPWTQHMMQAPEKDKVEVEAPQTTDTRGDRERGLMYILLQTLGLLGDHLFMVETRQEGGAGYILSFDTVAAHAWRQCRDPRDKVFGLQALVAPSRRVEIDYRKSAKQVFEEWMVETDTRKRYIAPNPQRVKETIRSLHSVMGLGEISQEVLNGYLEYSNNQGKEVNEFGEVVPVPSSSPRSSSQRKWWKKQSISILVLICSVLLYWLYRSHL